MKDVTMFHWLLSIKELSILNVKHLTIQSLKKEAKRNYLEFLEKEFSNDGIFEKVSILFIFITLPQLLFLIVTMYFVATEMRLLEGVTKKTLVNKEYNMP